MSWKDTLDLYTSQIFNAFTKGNKLKKDHLDGTSVCTVYDRIMTKKCYKKVINVYSFDLDYDKDIDSILFEILYEECPKVSVRFVDHDSPYKLNLRNDGIKNEYKRAITKYEETLAEFNQLNRADKALGKIHYDRGKTTKVDRFVVKRLKDRADSFDYAFNYSTRGGFYIHYKHIELMSESMYDLNLAVDKVCDILSNEKIEHQVLIGELGQYLSNFAPSGYKISSNPKSVGMLFTEENVAAQSCYAEHGVVGDTGVISGVNVENNAVQPINLSETTGGVVNGVLGRTGSGKSAMTKGMLLGHLANPNHFVSIMDYKGGEYDYLLKLFETGVEIKLDEYYVNFLNITGIPNTFSAKEKREFYDASVDGTCSLFEAMTNLQPNEGNFSDLSKLIRKAVIKVLHTKGVDRDQSHTYELSATAKYVDVLDILEWMTRQSYYSRQERDLLHICVSRTKDYLRPYGTKAYMFQKEVSFRQVLESRLIIYNFNKNQDSRDFTVEDNIRFTMMVFLNNKKTSYVKKMSKFMVVVYEELQRSGDGFVLREINHDVTGGRSNNKIIYLLFNSLNFMLTGSKDATAILDNITNLYVGLINKGTLDVLREKFDIEEIEDRILATMDNPLKMKHRFVIKLDTGLVCDTMWIKMDLPEDVMRTPLFTTRDKESDLTLTSSVYNTEQEGDVNA